VDYGVCTATLEDGSECLCDLMKAGDYRGSCVQLKCEGCNFGWNSKAFGYKVDREDGKNDNLGKIVIQCELEEWKRRKYFFKMQL